jgi:hypothetical protein
MSDARRPESTQGAVELMTAWLAAPDGPPVLMMQTLERHIEDHPSGDRLIGAVELIMGLTHLCGSLLALRELENGIPSQRSMQDLALEFIRVEAFASDLGLPDDA